jgi:hypothetical protein
MIACEQFVGLSVLGHGLSVHDWFTDLYRHLVEGTELTRPWRLPAWISDPKIVNHLLPFDVLQQYQIWHDIGKPECRVVDEEGKQHFPDHAEVSYRVWMSQSDGSEGSLLVGELIRKDMLAHTVKGEEAQEFIKDLLAPSLLLTALAEVHSNAAHMGRLDSDGFKMKCKQIEKIGKKLVA